MKKFRIILASFVMGLTLSVPTVVALAQCPQAIIVQGRRCVLVGEDCGPDVCVCAYICE